MPEDRPYLSYPFRSPRMDQSVPPNQVKIGSFGRLSGVDGRFSGGLRKYYGNKKVLDLDSVAGMGSIDAYNGPDYFRQVTFQKRNTSTVYRGFVIRWDSLNDTTDEQIDLIYTSDNGDTWSKLAIWDTGYGITSSLEIDCVVDRGYLIVAVDTKDTKTIYWNGSALVAIESGPGSFSTTLAAPTLNTTGVDTDYQLNGAGVYQVAWRFYDSTRGIYSALSDPVTIHMDHYKTTKAIGTVSFSSAGGDSGLLIDGDTITINGRVYEADDDSSYAGDVQIDILGLTSISEHTQALADAINEDSSAVVTASAQSASVLLESKVRGTAGNAYTLTKSETGANANDIAVSGTTLTGGGVVTTEPESQCKAVIDFPNHAAVVADETYDDFAALFDTVDIFRTIDLGNVTATTGAIFYLEQTIAKTGNWASSGVWDTLTATIGTIIDEALPFQTMYDPEKDIVSAPPQSGTIGRYEGQTYMAQAVSVDGGYDTLFSSAEHVSPEYFSTYNRHVGDPENGRPLRFLAAGNALFQLCYNAISFIFKSGKLQPIQISTLHRKRGIVGKEAAHASGNSIFMITGMGLGVLNGTDGSIGGISAVDRIIFDDWKSVISDVKSCYDAKLNASFFLNSSAEEMLILWHSTQTCSMLDGANFVGATSGPDIETGKNDRAFFITETGLIVSPDVLESGSGTMWDISDSYTLNGTVTTGGTTLTDSTATFHADMVGAKLYITSGDNAGLGRTISGVDVGTKTISFVSNFTNTIAVGDTYAISPVPFSLRAWPVQAEEISRFNRWGIVGVSIKARGISGFTDNVNDFWRVGAYRNSSAILEATTAEITVSENPSDSAGALCIDGIDIEPYIELISSGASFELTDAEFVIILSDSRTVNES
uniref:Putative tail protein n=1 Tax=viral metagenome TaxID=1070528 RepID=A0A6M3J5N0_9ZZZZ